MQRGTGAAGGTGGESATMEQLRMGCPMVVEAAKVDVKDTDGSIALTFTTASDNVDDLRTRVRHIARMYEMHGGRGEMMWHHMGGRTAGEMGRGDGAGRGAMAARGTMPAVRTRVEEIDRGARLVLTPADPAQLVTLREHLRMHQQRMQSGECWMLQQGAGSQQPGTGR